MGGEEITATILRIITITIPPITTTPTTPPITTTAASAPLSPGLITMVLSMATAGAKTMEREHGVTQLAGIVAAEIFIVQKGTPTTRGRIKLVTASGENNFQHQCACALGIF